MLTLSVPPPQGLSDEGDDESEGGDRRRNHKVTERLRRTEQRHLFNRLQTILHVHDAPKLRLLSLVSPHDLNIQPRQIDTYKTSQFESTLCGNLTHYISACSFILNSFGFHHCRRFLVGLPHWSTMAVGIQSNFDKI